jgi:hypothetical protein
MNKGLTRTVLFTAMAMMLSAGAAQPTNLTAVLNGANEVPPVPTDGTGLGTFVLNDVTLECAFQLDYQNLLAPTTAAHLHRAPAGVNGPVVYLLSGGNFPSGLQGTFQVNPADLPQLLNDGFYCNIHTQAFPGGEIRGQVDVAQVPVGPSTWGRIKNLWAAGR